MLLLNKLAYAAALALSLPAFAESAARLNPADPNIAVSDARYTSAFTQYQAAAADGPAPDKVWRTANNEVMQVDGAVPMAPVAGDGSVPKPASHSDHPGQVMPRTEKGK